MSKFTEIKVLNFKSSTSNYWIRFVLKNETIDYVSEQMSKRKKKSDHRSLLLANLSITSVLKYDFRWYNLVYCHMMNIENQCTQATNWKKYKCF